MLSQRNLTLGDSGGRIIIAKRGSEVGAHEVDPSFAVGHDLGVRSLGHCIDRVGEPACRPGQAKARPQPLSGLFTEVGRRFPRHGPENLGDLVNRVERRQPLGVALRGSVCPEVAEQCVEEGVPPGSIGLSSGPGAVPRFPDRLNRPLYSLVARRDGGCRGSHEHQTARHCARRNQKPYHLSHRRLRRLALA